MTSINTKSPGVVTPQVREVGKEQLRYHFSIDDIFESLIEVTDRNIPLFEHPYFALLKDLHNKYGTHVSLYVFFQREMQGRLRTLSEVRDLKNELEQAGNWIHFGPHALDFDTRPYNQSPEDQVKVFDATYKEIDRFAGKNTYAELVRLHFYSESYELADYFKSHGVMSLLSTDREAGSHRMPQQIKDGLLGVGEASYEGAHFIRTQFRVEFFVQDGLDERAIEILFRESFKKFGYVTLYTHEYELVRKEVLEKLELSLKVLHSLSNAEASQPNLPEYFKKSV